MQTFQFVAGALLGTVLTLDPGGTVAAQADGCTHFTWDVSRELALMQQPPQALTAAIERTGNVPQLKTEQLYEVKLAPQGTVTYAPAPGKPAADASTGGLVNFQVAAGGLYRISLSSRHWIDVIADGKVIKSRDFQGAHDCERPHKVVEFELPANQLLTLQFSGAAAPAVLVSITAVAAAPVH